ncbi:MAG: threonine ammonia-lyase [Dehalococcoidia bacterium]|nr:threonine ammonia-lyase [Dehalococcoidia bacterium]
MLTLSDIQDAAALLRDVVRHTPLVFSHTYSRETGARVYLKTENLQRTGSFKIRGAYVKMCHLSPEARRAGVIAASAGNHAQGVAFAGAHLGIPTTIVMPVDAALAKVEATRARGAEVILHGSGFDQAQTYARHLQRQRGLVMVPAFDDDLVMAGQGTLALEILQDLPDPDLLLAPVGGGGMIAGIALAVKERNPSVKVIGVQASAAPAAAASFRCGRREERHASPTVADGIAVQRPGRLTFPIMKKHVDDIVTVGEEEISHAMVMLLERSKLLVEGAGAVGLAALLSGRVRAEGQKVVVVLSGGNVDINQVAKVIHHGLSTAGRYLILRTRLQDRSGQLYHLLSLVAEMKVNVIDIQHHRERLGLPLGQAEVELTLETRDANHRQEIIERLTGKGYEVEV